MSAPGREGGRAGGKPVRAPGMYRSIPQERESNSVHRVHGIVIKDLRWTFRDSSDHLDYWLRYALPVLVVIVDRDDNAFWEVVTPETAKETPEGFMMLIPRSQPFGITAREKLLGLAQHGQRLVDSFPDFLAVLPPSAITPLNGAAEVDRLAAARLGHRLSVGRAAPDMTAATVIAAEPSGLTASRAAQDLWLAVAGYAAGQLQQRGVHDPERAALRLLPGVDLPR